MPKSNIINQKNKRWVILGSVVLLILIIVIIGKLTGCSDRGENAISSGKVDLTPTNELVLDIPGYRWFPEIYKKAMDEFRKQYPNVKLTINRLGDKENYPTDQYQTALTNELMAGSGPDVVLIDYFMSDLYKTMDTGSFLDLSSIIKGDKDFNMEDYNTSIMDGGNYKGGQYIMPLGYSAQILVTDQSGLDSIGFDKTKVTDSTSLFREISKCVPKAEENQYFSRMTDKPILTSSFYSSGISLVDENNKKILPDKEEFRAFCEAYQPFYKTDNNKDKPYSGTIYDMYSQGILPFGYTNANSLWIIYWGYIKSKGGNPVILAPKSVNGGLCATITNGVAIRSGSTNQLNAWNFIKILLSAPIQGMDVNSDGFGYPVNREGIKSHLQKYKKLDKSGITNDGEESELVDLTFLTDKDIEEFQTVLNGFSGSTLRCKPLDNLFTKCMEPYFKGEKELDSCMDNLGRQLDLYITE